MLGYSPAEHVLSPTSWPLTLGFTQLQFEALLTAAPESVNDCDFALVAVLGLLGLKRGAEDVAFLLRSSLCLALIVMRES